MSLAPWPGRADDGLADEGGILGAEGVHAGGFMEVVARAIEQGGAFAAVEGEGVAAAAEGDLRVGEGAFGVGGQAEGLGQIVEGLPDAAGEEREEEDEWKGEESTVDSRQSTVRGKPRRRPSVICHLFSVIASEASE